MCGKMRQFVMNQAIDHERSTAAHKCQKLQLQQSDRKP